MAIDPHIAASAEHSGRGMKPTPESASGTGHANPACGQRRLGALPDRQTGECRACARHRGPCLNITAPPKADTAAKLAVGTAQDFLAVGLHRREQGSCLQLHGGYGYMTEYAVARDFLDARGSTLYAGTTEIMKEVIGRAVAG
ncbi:hypothetical protein GCM10023205_77310 [Yinghuangia aomiensis]|uniref:Acyl-CoA dehydrogenase/oxidase C-terminal domain-containing protein n=1 Tax=Yinghuangia aomiensis TaxID=676205 RepID=A0ABP9IBU5_9ACTN